LCGLLTFGSTIALRRHLPLTRVDYIRVPGRKWERDPAGKFHALELRGPLLTLIPRVIATVLDDLPRAFTFGEDQVHRREVPAVPQQVLREAIVNAVMHRSYRARGAVQIIRYSNRLEIRNPGHSLKPDDRLGEPGSLARNEKIAAILHETGLAETKGSGIRVMRDLMQTANLTPPIFESDRDSDSFAATFLVHHFFSEQDVRWLSLFGDCELSQDDARALLIVRELGAITNAVFRNQTRLETLAASGRLRRLRGMELLEQKGKGNQTFYVPGPRLAAELSRWRGDAMEPKHVVAVQPPAFPGKPLSEGPRSLSEEVAPSLKALSEEEILRAELPPDLVADIAQAGKRTTPDVLEEIIYQLCRWRPLTLVQLAQLTDRKPEHIRQRALRALLSSGRLMYERPNLLSHPSQRYVASEPKPAAQPSSN
jgi:ATP-dependent DNA helicase RecG